MTGLENTVWSYGKDVAKTISLASINYDTDTYADSSYITSNSYSDSKFNGSFKNGGSINSKYNDIYGLLETLVANKQEPAININLNIEHFENNSKEDINQLMKEISYYLEMHKKRW